MGAGGGAGGERDAAAGPVVDGEAERVVVAALGGDDPLADDAQPDAGRDLNASPMVAPPSPMSVLAVAVNALMVPSVSAVMVVPSGLTTPT